MGLKMNKKDRLLNDQERLGKIEDRIETTQKPPDVTTIEELRILKKRMEKTK